MVRSSGTRAERHEPTVSLGCVWVWREASFSVNMRRLGANPISLPPRRTVSLVCRFMLQSPAVGLPATSRKDPTNEQQHELNHHTSVIGHGDFWVEDGELTQQQFGRMLGHFVSGMSEAQQRLQVASTTGKTARDRQFDEFFDACLRDSETTPDADDRRGDSSSRADS